MFEVKFFLKVGPGQRREIERVLQRMEEINPYKVVIVAPVELTAATLDWFDYIGSRYSFELEWFGESWLDRKLREYADVQAAFADLLTNRTESLLDAVVSSLNTVATVDEARQALNAGKFSQLIGAHECIWLDVKEGSYRMEDDASAAELLKDVAAFANSDGGLLVVGYRTLSEATVEVVGEIRPVPKVLVDTDRYRKTIRKNIAPHVRGLKITWHDIGADKGILVIDIPVQAETDKPFVVPGPERSKSFPSVGVPIRDADATHWLARSDLQRFLSAGWNGGRSHTSGPLNESD
ncbi:AlbA family DNA-binding domain-containing protein [Actinophytocola xanthii]|uniref:AlbA family DNA-binding domain-containing protein n=1 Tax=Actinophytocola xanthii TaxID=1912961 RepID=UPI0011777D36|nr:ATP-binding protein [Actinophytocola xanthii]